MWPRHLGAFSLEEGVVNELLHNVAHYVGHRTMGTTGYFSTLMEHLICTWIWGRCQEKSSVCTLRLGGWEEVGQADMRLTNPYSTQHGIAHRLDAKWFYLFYFLFLRTCHRYSFGRDLEEIQGNVRLHLYNQGFYKLVEEKTVQVLFSNYYIYKKM